MKKLLFFIIFGIFIIGYFLSQPEPIQAAGWLSGFNYRKEINISNTGSTLTNYQMKLTVHKGSGTDSGSDVYLNNHCQDDFDDIRFTKSDGTTELDHWRESYTAGTSAVFWIEFDSLTGSGSTTFYIYYDNPTASSASNGDNTFDFFDDFSGTSLDSNKWTEDAIGNITQTVNGYLRITDVSTERWAIEDGTDTGDQHQAIWTPIDSFVIEWTSLTNGTQSNDYYQVGVAITESDDTIIYWSGAYAHSTYDNRPEFDIRDESGGEVEWDISTDTEYDIQMIRDGNNYELKVDGVSKDTFSSNTTPSKVAIAATRSDRNFPNYIQITNFKIRKYASPEPTWGTWGSEEEAGPPIILSVADSPDPVNSGFNITFTVDWSDPGDQTKIHICKTDAISGQTCSAGSWCDSAAWSATSPTSCSYMTSGTGIRYYYTFVCDDENNCSDSVAGTFDVVSPPPPCQAHNVFGYAWSENIGWIDFSCQNTYSIGEGIDYGVDISASTGEFSGYAWSENIGWIDFGPEGPYPEPPNYSACLDFPGSGQVCDDLPGVNKVGGWARALAYDGGWDGWIKLRDTDYGVDFDSQSGEFSGFAWGSNVMGWTSFKGDNYVVVTTAKLPPTVSTDGETWQHCTYKGRSIPILHWDYSDGTQAAYWVQIDDTSASFPSPEVDTGEISLSSQSYAADGYDFSWSTKYWWRVKVKNQDGVWSSWSNIDDFWTPDHAYPWPDFSWEPLEPTQGEVVVFEPDSSETFGGTTISSYQWTVTEGEGVYVDDTNEFSQYPHIIFNTETNKVTLKITDTDGYSCTCSEKEITAQLPLPEYKEVPPIIWLKRVFLAVVKFFNGWF